MLRTTDLKCVNLLEPQYVKMMRHKYIFFLTTPPVLKRWRKINQKQAKHCKRWRKINQKQAKHCKRWRGGVVAK